MSITGMLTIMGTGTGITTAIATVPASRMSGASRPPS
jgi:hypothetical protein